MVEIKTDAFTLRPFRNEDAEAFHFGINNKRIEDDTTIPLPWKLDDIRWWIGFINNAATRQPITELHFVIEIAGILAGSIGIINIYGHKGEIGYWLKEEYAGKGVMSRVVKNFTEYAFEMLKLRRIFAPILPHNKASAKVLENNGFQMEGVLKSFYLKKGKYIDALCYAKVTL